MIRRNNHLKLGRYHQHLHELLELDLSPLDYMMKKFPEFKDRDEMRKVIGRYGISGKAQVILKFISRQNLTYNLLLLRNPVRFINMTTSI